MGLVVLGAALGWHDRAVTALSIAGLVLLAVGASLDRADPRWGLGVCAVGVGLHAVGSMTRLT